jgi:hypothetical protein
MSTTIRLLGEPKQNEEHVIENGYVEVEYDVNYVLDIIGSKDITQYALDNLYLINPEDFEYNIDHFTNEDMVKGLKSNGYDFTQQLDEEQCIDFLEDKGYKIDERTDVDELDIVDQDKLNKIIEKFTASSWIYRDIMYKSCCS